MLMTVKVSWCLWKPEFKSCPKQANCHPVKPIRKNIFNNSVCLYYNKSTRRIPEEITAKVQQVPPGSMPFRRTRQLYVGAVWEIAVQRNLAQLSKEL